MNKMLSPTLVWQALGLFLRGAPFGFFLPALVAVPLLRGGVTLVVPLIEGCLAVASLFGAGAVLLLLRTVSAKPQRRWLTAVAVLFAIACAAGCLRFLLGVLGSSYGLPLAALSSVPWYLLGLAGFAAYFRQVMEDLALVSWVGTALERWRMRYYALAGALGLAAMFAFAQEARRLEYRFESVVMWAVVFGEFFTLMVSVRVRRGLRKGIPFGAAAATSVEEGASPIAAGVKLAAGGLWIGAILVVVAQLREEFSNHLVDMAILAGAATITAGFGLVQVVSGALDLRQRRTSWALRLTLGLAGVLPLFGALFGVLTLGYTPWPDPPPPVEPSARIALPEDRLPSDQLANKKLIKSSDLPMSREIVLPDEVRSCALHPDGNSFALGFENGHVEFRSLPTGTVLGKSIQAHSAMIPCLAYRHDGKELATAAGKTVKIWNLESGQEVKAIDVPSEVHTLAMSPAGQWLAACWWHGKGYSVRILNMNTWMEAATFPGTPLAFSPDGATLATAGTDEFLKFHDPATGKETNGRRFNASVINAVYGPDAKHLAVTIHPLLGRPSLVLWNRESNYLTDFYLKDGVQSCAFSRDGKRLLIGDSDGNVHLLETLGLKNLATYPHLQGARGVAGRIRLRRAFYRFLCVR